MMMTSPILTPHSRSMSHTPSPTSSPKLVPVPSTIAGLSNLSLSSSASPCSSSNAAVPTLSASLPTRSFVRGPQARPYGSHLQSKKKVLDQDTVRFAEVVANYLGKRRRNSSLGGGEKGEKGLIEMIENVNLHSDGAVPRKIERGPQARRMNSGLAAGSWEADTAELIVDYPVWSPGCFQDLSTLHALRDQTLSHTHSLLSFLSDNKSVHTTYRLLARSAVPAPGPNPSPFLHGWGCIRLSPSAGCESGRAGAKVRRASVVHSGKSSFSPERTLNDSAIFESDDDSVRSLSPAQSPRRELGDFRLRIGYSSDSPGCSDDENEEETADVIVAREIEKRGGKEGMVFMMTLFDQPALILT